MNAQATVRAPQRDGGSDRQRATPAQMPPAAAAHMLALQRGAGNHAVARMIAASRGEPSPGGAGLDRPLTTAVLQRALVATRSKSGWVITGRPPFSSATTTAMPVDTGDHRAHTTAWESIRNYVQAMLNSKGGDDHVYEVAIVHLLQPHMPSGGYDTTTAFKELTRVRAKKSGGEEDVRSVLTELNGLLDNLDEGHGRTNSTIQGHYDPKVVVSGSGYDLRIGDRETITATAHLVKPLLLDETGTFVFASTFNLEGTRGRIPVSKAVGTLRDMIEGDWYEQRKPTAKRKPAAKKKVAVGKHAKTQLTGVAKPSNRRKATASAQTKTKKRPRKGQ